MLGLCVVVSHMFVEVDDRLLFQSAKEKGDKTVVIMEEVVCLAYNMEGE